MSAKGAGNRDPSLGPETTKAKKRRAFAGCRESELRVKTGLSEIECTVKVNKGDTAFMLDILDAKK